MDEPSLDITWRSALLLMLIAPTFLVAVRLFFHGTERVACRWLAAFLVAFCLDTVPQVIGFAGAYDVWPGLTFAPLSYQLWFGPLIYLHAHVLMRKTPLRWRYALLVPGVLQLGYYLWAFTSLGDYRAKWAFNDAFHMPYIAPVQLGLSLALAIGCGVAVLRLVGRYRQFASQTQSIASELDPSWLARCLWSLGVALLVWLTFEAADMAVGPLGYVGRYPMFVVIGAVLMWMGIEALARIRVPFVPLSDAGAPDNAATDAASTQKDWPVLGRSLNDRMLSEAWHLEPRFSLRDLARRTGMNESYVSRAINRGLDRNFNQMVNEARVATARERLVTHPDETILAVAHASGFNAKATFNRVFRDVAGQTPSAWRRAALSRDVS
ncbi:MAG: helix-turn-helix domain-containing protein, partial [Pseudomonadota bacterium]